MLMYVYCTPNAQEKPWLFFPTYQVRVARFYVSSTAPSPPSSPPDPNSKPRIRVAPAGPDLQGRDRTGSQTASPGSEWSLPDSNSKREMAVVLAGPEQQALGRKGPHQTLTTQNLRMYIR